MAKEDIIRGSLVEHSGCKTIVNNVMAWVWIETVGEPVMRQYGNRFQRHLNSRLIEVEKEIIKVRYRKIPDSQLKVN